MGCLDRRFADNSPRWGGGIGIVFAPVFAPDGTRIASFGAGGTKVWSVGPRFTSESVVNAASFVSGPVAPGEIISIFGAGLGPETPARGVVDPRRVVCRSPWRA